MIKKVSLTFSVNEVRRLLLDSAGDLECDVIPMLEVVLSDKSRVPEGELDRVVLSFYCTQ